MDLNDFSYADRLVVDIILHGNHDMRLKITMRFAIRKSLTGLMLLVMAMGGLYGCDAGDKVIDEATGNRALKQYEMTRDKMKAIDEKQKERYKTMEDDTREDK